LRRVVILAACVLATLAGFERQALAQGPSSATDVASAAPTAVASSQHELNQRDVDAWLDGFMPYALEQGDIAGAVVVVVRDGRVLTQRGFGYADVGARTVVDPDKTLFRAGSISKLFTWIAVMQLVEQGRIDLDADINQSLDFQIPAYRGEPTTMRQIMTHTAGFEEAFKGGITFGEGSPPPLGDAVKALLPARVFAPGTTPAYSNVATALAGYVVERVSGTPFDAYIEQRIFEPLGMRHSTFRQPVPESLRPFVAKGYPDAHSEPKGFELISVPPAGSASMTGADAARFMISNLQGAAGLMRPETAALMFAPATTSVPGLNRMALGFYQQRVNDIVAIGHGGDLGNFHSYLWLIPEHNVGVFVAVNSAGTHLAPYVLRRALFEQFVDRYFPAADRAPPQELPTASEHARMLVGSYFSSRGTFTNFIDFGNLLSQTRVGLDSRGRLVVPDVFDGPLRRWIEVEPFVWRDANGHGRLAAVVENGRVVRWSVDDMSPFMVYLPVPWHRDAAWLLPLWLMALGIIAIAALAWPAGAIIRRRYGVTHVLSPMRAMAMRATGALCWLVPLAVGGWMLLFDALGDGPADGVIWLLEIAGAIGFFGLFAAALWSAVLTWAEERGWGSKVGSMLLSASAAVVLYVALVFHLIHFGAKY
jgi:CubicO group peptidase (beta-lactamase class C family)